MSSDTLKAHQAHALLDILSHHEVYAEIRAFRSPNRLSSYGPPFHTSPKEPSTSPSLQALVSGFALPLPGLKNVSQNFWNEHVASLIANLEEAELSESYDKGHVGIRRTLATACSALIEYPVRGVFAGFDEPTSDSDKEYNISDAKDLQAACRNFLQLVVYGDLVDELFEMGAKTDRLEDHRTIVQATHEYGLVNLASFIHYALVLSPKGQQLLTMIDQVNRLIPYGIIRQTLKIGNVASMISAMMKVVLAKMSMASVTNWVGWTQNADEGMNLMQQIISTVLHYDTRDFKSKASKIEKDKHGPKKEQLEALKKYIEKSRKEHETLREKSYSQKKSIVAIILEDASVSTNLSESQHTQALNYLSYHLSIRDREQIIHVLCHSNPDHLTQAVRDAVAAYEPVIRHVHQAVDLSETVWDFERFLKDLIKLAKIPTGSDAHESQKYHHFSSSKPKQQPLPTVGDFIQLLRKHQYNLHKFLHHIAKNGPEMTSWFHDYIKEATTHFQRSTHQDDPSSSIKTKGSSERTIHDAGALTSELNTAFLELPQDQQNALRPILDAQAAYLASLHAASSVRLAAVLSCPPSNHPVISEPLQLYRPGGPGSHPASGPSSRSHSPSKGSDSPRLRPVGGSSSKISKMAHESSNAQEGADANPGPGAFLARWQALLDAAAITPADMHNGEVRGGMHASVIKASRANPERKDGAKDGELSLESQTSANSANSTATATSGKSESTVNHDNDDDDDDDVFEEALERIDMLGLKEGDKAPRPDTTPVVDALSEKFATLLGERGCTW